MITSTFYSNGKLLLTGEYVVLDGATALAIPTRLGQSLTVAASEGQGIYWESKDVEGNVWFTAHFSEKEIASEKMMAPVSSVSQTLCTILQHAKKLNPLFLKDTLSYKITTSLGFPQDWGLGSSSTLINNIAQWAEVDAFTLLQQSFGGSGYDIAAAQNDAPILYKLENKEPKVRTVHLPWEFTDSLFFVHLNQKQDSKEGIARYKATKEISKGMIQRISDISSKLLLCYTLKDFEQLMQSHEQIISGIIDTPTVKERLFPDYSHTIKSLGAWGGDFVLVTGTTATMDYFRKKGYTTIIPFHKMIK